LLVCISGDTGSLKDANKYWDGISINAVFCKKTCPSVGCGGVESEKGAKSKVNWSTNSIW